MRMISSVSKLSGYPDELQFCVAFPRNSLINCHGRLSSSLAAAAKSLQSCPTLCDPIDGSPPGSPVARIRQARTLEWVAISFSNAWKWKVKVKSLSRVRLLPTPWTAAHQAPLSMGFSRQEYWSGLPLPSPSGLDIHSQMIWFLYKSAYQSYLPITPFFSQSPKVLAIDTHLYC